MSIDCVEFIDIAERILTIDDQEISWRVAAGRAYYGAFHCCRDLINRQPSILVNGQLGEHERLYQAVNSLGMGVVGAKDLKKLVYKTMQLRDVRVAADYHIAQHFRKEQAAQAIEAARHVHLLYKQFRAEHKI